MHARFLDDGLVIYTNWSLQLGAAGLGIRGNDSANNGLAYPEETARKNSMLCNLRGEPLERTIFDGDLITRCMIIAPVDDLHNLES